MLPLVSLLAKFASNAGQLMYDVLSGLSRSRERRSRNADLVPTPSPQTPLSSVGSIIRGEDHSRAPFTPAYRHHDSVLLAGHEVGDVVAHDLWRLANHLA